MILSPNSSLKLLSLCNKYKTVGMDLFRRGSKQNKINFLNENCLTMLSVDSIWIYTLMKSGTTYTLVFLANYLNNLFGDGKNVSFDQMQDQFFFHSVDTRIEQKKLGSLIQKRNKVSPLIPSVIHTHKMLEYGLWVKNISLYRNPLDYTISSYYFHHINRGKNVKHPRLLMEQKINSFIKTYKNQLQIKEEHPQKTMLKCYEELMRQPKDVFCEMINFLGIELNEEALVKSIENASIKNIKKMEKQRGEAIVIPQGKKFKGSFVRSGKIGEWKEYFNDEDLKKAEAILNQQHLSLNNFILE